MIDRPKYLESIGIESSKDRNRARNQPFVRDMIQLTVINTGSVSQSFDGDPRASYLLIDSGTPEVRSIPYDIEQEIRAIKAKGLPDADWMTWTLRTARPQSPSILET
jgi:hypothetical protein